MQKLLVQIYGTLAERERCAIRERQAKGTAAAGKKGSLEDALGKSPKNNEKLSANVLYSSWKKVPFFDGDLRGGGNLPSSRLGGLPVRQLCWSGALFNHTVK